MGASSLNFLSLTTQDPGRELRQVQCRYGSAVDTCTGTGSARRGILNIQGHFSVLNILLVIDHGNSYSSVHFVVARSLSGPLGPLRRHMFAPAAQLNRPAWRSAATKRWTAGCPPFSVDSDCALDSCVPARAAAADWRIDWCVRRAAEAPCRAEQPAQSGLRSQRWPQRASTSARLGRRR